VICALALILNASRVIAEDLPAALRNFEEKCVSRHAAIQDLTIITDFVIHSPNGDVPSVHTLREKGSKIRMDVARVDETGIIGGRLDFVGISDDKHSWTINRDGQRHETDDSAVNQQDPNFVCWQFSPENTKVTGEEELRGRQCTVVETWVRHTQKRLWLDKELQVVLQYEEIAPSGSVTRWEASNFNTVTGDFKLPQKTDMYLGDHLMATVLIQSATFNTGLTDDVFNPEKVSFDP